jgi:hypothetical protein
MRPDLPDEHGLSLRAIGPGDAALVDTLLDDLTTY